MATWLTLDEARDRWRDAGALDDDVLQQYLDVASQQVLTYGPKRLADAIAADPNAVPENYRMAQLMQARNTWNSIKTDPGGFQGADPGFSFTPFPLDWTVKAVIRPPSAKPVVR